MGNRLAGTVVILTGAWAPLKPSCSSPKELRS